MSSVRDRYLAVYVATHIRKCNTLLLSCRACNKEVLTEFPHLSQMLCTVKMVKKQAIKYAIIMVSPADTNAKIFQEMANNIFGRKMNAT